MTWMMTKKMKRTMNKIDQIYSCYGSLVDDDEMDSYMSGFTIRYEVDQELTMK
jgi:hypothetical protein